MNANAPTFTPQAAKSSPSTTLSDATNTKGSNDSAAKATTSKTDITSSSKSNEKSPTHGTQQQRRKQQSLSSSAKKRFPTPAAEASSSRHGATNQQHQNTHTNNHAAAKNKSKRHTQNRPQTSRQTEPLEMLETTQQVNADKKGRVSLNHLLSFSFPTRQQQPAYTPRRHKPTSYQPFNKERFVNANFRFVVKPSGNYLANIIDPDSSFEWDNIEHVLITGEEALSCPICLSPPTAARVTKCGHTFCYNCILHYLELREPKKQWRKCPICWESIYARDLKSVRSVHPFAVSRPSTSSATETVLSSHATTQTNVVNVTEGDMVELCLMQRSNKSTLALPLSDTWPMDDTLTSKHQNHSDPNALTLMPWHFTPDVMLFGRFMLASPDYLLMENDRDIRELKAALKEAKEWGAMEDLPFIETGLRQLGQDAETIGNMYMNKSLENAVQATEQLLDQAKLQHPHHHRQQQQQQRQENGALPTTAATTDHDLASATTPINEDDIPEAYKQHHMQRAGMEDMHSSTTNGSTMNSQQPQQQEEKQQQKQKQQQQQQQQQMNRQHPTTEFYFYQAKDGQHIYLHPLDIRILKYEYGDYQHFPPLLQVKAMGIEETTLTEDIRNRLRYIGHLPLSCDVTFIEIDIKPLVSKQTTNHFQGELKLRHKKRQDRIKREEKAIKKSAIMQQKRQVQETRREEQTRREDDPFFQTYQPMTMEENDRMLKEALETSALEAQQNQHQPKTVWGTPAVANNANEQVDAQPQQWADHIAITPGRRKTKGRRK